MSSSGGASGSGSQAAGPSGSGSRSAAASNSTSISIPGTAAAGGITILNPANTAEASYYKIASEEYITFQWNLTSL